MLNIILRIEKELISKKQDMHWRLFILSIQFLLCVDIQASINEEKFINKIDTILTENKINKGDFSLSLQMVNRDNSLVSINSQKQRHPASLIKIVTTLGALEILGPNYYWETLFFTDGKIIDNSLIGNLFIKGKGDPFLTIEDLWKIVYEFRKLSVLNIEGQIFIDNTFFQNTNKNNKQTGNRLYEVEPNALMTNFKRIDFHIKMKNKVAEILPFPPLENLKIKNQIRPSNKSCSSKNIKLVFTENSYSNNVLISGEIPHSCKEYKLSRSVLSAEDYFFYLFKYIWESTDNGKFTPTYSFKKLPTDAIPLITWKSKKLGSVVKSTNKWSNNLMSKTLIYSLGYDPTTGRALPELGIKSIQNFLSAHNLSSNTLNIIDGSGLNKDVRASTEDIIRILNFAWARNIMPEFVASLSIAGKDGTTRNLFKGMKLGNAVRIKTGTLNDVISAGGYIFANSGNIYSLATIINKPYLNKTNARNTLERIIKLIAETY